MTGKIIKLVIAALFVVTFVATAANNKEVSIQTNLHCGSCAAKIEKGIKKTSGIITSKADVSSKVVTIKYDADKTDESKINEKKKKMGYTTEVMKTTANSKKSCCTDKKVTDKDCCDTKATKSAPKK